MLVIQQEQLDLWQLSLQLLRDAGMGQPAASSRCNPRAGETRCPALPGAAIAVEEEQNAAGAPEEQCQEGRFCAGVRARTGKCLSERQMPLSNDICLHSD